MKSSSKKHLTQQFSQGVHCIFSLRNSLTFWQICLVALFLTIKWEVSYHFLWLSINYNTRAWRKKAYLSITTQGRGGKHWLPPKCLIFSGTYITNPTSQYSVQVIGQLSTAPNTRPFDAFFAQLFLSLFMWTTERNTIFHERLCENVCSSYYKFLFSRNITSPLSLWWLARHSAFEDVCLEQHIWFQTTRPLHPVMFLMNSLSSTSGLWEVTALSCYQPINIATPCM